MQIPVIVDFIYIYLSSLVFKYLYIIVDMYYYKVYYKAWKHIINYTYKVHVIIAGKYTQVKRTQGGLYIKYFLHSRTIYILLSDAYTYIVFFPMHTHITF